MVHSLTLTKIDGSGSATYYGDMGAAWHNLCCDLADEYGCQPESVDGFDVWWTGPRGFERSADIVLVGGELVGTTDGPVDDDDIRCIREELTRLAEVEAYRRAAQ